MITDDVQLDSLRDAVPHTCYSAPVAVIVEREALVPMIPWFAVRPVSHAQGLAVGHLRGWSPASVGLSVNARDSVDESAVDEAVAGLREAGSGIVRFDARELPWVGARQRWLRWQSVRVTGDDFVIEDRLSIEDGPHRQSPAMVRIDESGLRRVLASGSRPTTSAELRREAVFLDADQVAASAALLWLVPGADRRDAQDARWVEGTDAFTLAAEAIGTAVGDEIAFWQEECWQAARYRKQVLARSGSPEPTAYSAAALEERSEQFTLAAGLLLHASLMPSEDRRSAKLERAAAVVAALAETDEGDVP